MIFRSIRWRLVAGYLFLAILSVTVVGVVALSLVKRYTDRQEVEYLRANAEAIARRAEPLLWLPHRHIALQELAQTAAFLGNAQVKILDNQQQVLADSGSQAMGDRFIWIASIPPGSNDQPEADMMQFHSAESLGMFQSKGSERRVFSLVVLPGTEAAPVLNEKKFAVQWQQLPPGTEFTTGRRVGDGWGGRIIFDDVGVVEAMPAASGPAGEPQFTIRLAGSGHEAVKVRPLDAPAGSLMDAPGLDETPARSDQILTIAIGDPTAPQGYVELSNGPNFGQEAVATTRRAFVFAALGAMALAVLVGLFVSRDLTAPLIGLTTAATEMSNGDLAVRAPILGQDEFGQLAQQFNQMAERLESSFAELAAERDALRRFIADASHELRTPITALKNFNELLQYAAANDPDARAEFLAESESQIKRLEWITHNLLNLSRFDAGLVALDLDDHDLGEILTGIAGLFKQQAQEKGVKLEVQLPSSPIILRCDRARLELVISNLIENSLKFASPGGSIDLGVTVENRVVHIWVRDDGIGIDPLDLPNLFERFYRGHNHNHEGSGLGLAIVRSIVQTHGGRVTVEGQPGQGSQFLIEFPINP